MAIRRQGDIGDALAAQALGMLESRLWDTHGAPIPAVQVVIADRTGSLPLKDRLIAERDDLEKSLTTISAQLTRRNEQIAELERYPEVDPYTDDTVLRFKKAFASNPDKKYTYTASKVEGLWYVTGPKSPDGVDWTELVIWMGLGVTDIFKIAPGRAAKVNWSELR